MLGCVVYALFGLGLVLASLKVAFCLSHSSGFSPKPLRCAQLPAAREQRRSPLVGRQPLANLRVAPPLHLSEAFFAHSGGTRPPGGRDLDISWRFFDGSFFGGKDFSMVFSSVIVNRFLLLLVLCRLFSAVFFPQSLPLCCLNWLFVFVWLY